MRITTPQQFNTIQNNILGANTQMFKYQQQVSSGKTLTAASEDPAAYDRLMQLRQSTLEATQYSSNTAQLRTQMQSYDSSLNNVSDVLAQARSLASQAATDTIDAQARQQLASQVDQLLTQTLDLANSYENGHYLYAGSKDQSPPFSAVHDSTGKVTDITYNGDERVSTVKVSASANLQSSFSGTQIFGSKPGSSDSVMGSLIALRDAITTGNAKQISAQLAGLDTVSSNTVGARAQVGVRIQHLDNLDQVRQQNMAAISAEQSSLEDANLPAALTSLSQMQSTYQAALTVAAKMSSLSLINRLQ